MSVRPSIHVRPRGIPRSFRPVWWARTKDGGEYIIGQVSDRKPTVAPLYRRFRVERLWVTPKSHLCIQAKWLDARGRTFIFTCDVEDAE